MQMYANHTNTMVDLKRRAEKVTVHKDDSVLSKCGRISLGPVMVTLVILVVMVIIIIIILSWEMEAEI